eukprot:GHVS01042991.1.p3 GENE.GHVS01042991.1~~GHVS01042991.1.p3  ORF type:complete len:101 (+),score=6.23 GHVS01042991.1:306-608(+)
MALCCGLRPISVVALAGTSFAGKDMSARATPSYLPQQGTVVLTYCFCKNASGQYQTLELKAAYTAGHKTDNISSDQMDENGHVCILTDSPIQCTDAIKTT